MSKYKMIWCPSKTIEDGASLRFFLVDLSHRKVVLLRGAPRWKGLGGINTYTSVPFCTTFPLALWSILRLSVSMQNEGFLVLVVLGHAVVLLMGAVVPQSPTVVPARDVVVPQALAVVPLPGRGSTVASGQAQQHERK